MDFITQHAKDNVWAEHIQDKDYYIRPARITPNGGSLKYAEVGMKSIALPNASLVNSNLYYHVYHIGQIPTHILGIDLVENKWLSIDEIASKSECYVNVFLDNGYVVPRSKCFLLRTWPGKNILLAIEYDPKASFGFTKSYDHVTNASVSSPNTLNNKDINLRFYTNARHFATDRRDNATNVDNQMYFETGAYTRNVNQRIKANKSGAVEPKQGWFVLEGQIMNYEAVVNDYPKAMDKEISVYRDETIIGIEYHKVQDLKTFVSNRNRNIKKYLINLQTPPDQLVYYNDVEYYLGKMDTHGAFRGLCIPMLRINPITTITNKTHAIRTDTITDLMTSNDWMVDSQNVYLMVVIRQGGMLRGLVHQHTRIEELFKLPEPIVMSALTGVNSLLDEWKASTLEQDDYATIIEATDKAIVPDIVFNAYGYNAITRYHHPNPLVVNEYTTDDSGKNWYAVQLSNAASERNKLLTPGGLHLEVIEYDKDGLFIGRKRFPYANGGLLVSTQDVDRKVHLVEHYVNNVESPIIDVGEDFKTRIEDNDLAIFGFAAYITTSPSNDLQPKWIDITNLNSYYYLTDTVKTDGSKIRTLVWNLNVLNDIGARPMVRINNRVCFKTYKVKDLTKGYRSFPVITLPNNSQGKIQVEPGTIELWLEQRLLIEDIDYVVKWPNIYIGKRIIDIETAEIHVRLTGLADPYTSQHYKARETGFVKGGVLSVNNLYDIRNDRNIQINVGGAVKNRDEVSFDEKKTTASVIDGRPYQIRDYITPVELYSNRSTVLEKEKSEDLDSKVMGYLNEYLTTSDTRQPIINNTRWMVVSVFLDDIISRLLKGWLGVEVNTTWTSEQVEAWVDDVKYLLSVDIAYFETTNKNYIRLIPHGKPTTIRLTQQQYKLVEYIADKYLNGVVQINHMIAIDIGA